MIDRIIRGATRGMIVGIIIGLALAVIHFN